jgi:hypothetical protein
MDVARTANVSHKNASSLRCMRIHRRSSLLTRSTAARIHRQTLSSTVPSASLYHSQVIVDSTLLNSSRVSTRHHPKAISSRRCQASHPLRSPDRSVPPTSRTRLRYRHPIQVHKHSWAVLERGSPTAIQTQLVCHQPVRRPLLLLPPSIPPITPFNSTTPHLLPLPPMLPRKPRMPMMPYHCSISSKYRSRKH